MSDLPSPDQAAASEAASEAAHARSDALREVSAGTLTLAGLYERINVEERPVLGHIHVRAALLAHPHIGDVKADAIIEALGVKPGEHLERLGSRQRDMIEQLAASEAE